MPLNILPPFMTKPRVYPKDLKVQTFYKTTKLHGIIAHLTANHGRASDAGDRWGEGLVTPGGGRLRLFLVTWKTDWGGHLPL